MHIYDSFESLSLFPPNNLFDLADCTKKALKKVDFFFYYHTSFLIWTGIYLCASESPSLDWDITSQ